MSTGNTMLQENAPARPPESNMYMDGSGVSGDSWRGWRRAALVAS